MIIFVWIFFVCFFSCLESKSIQIYVYRAQSIKSLWKYHLQNCNAADAGGVLSYVHADIIPKDMGSGKIPDCKRKGDIDIISKFRVTIENPHDGHHHTPPVNYYVPYHHGKCSSCQQQYDRDGYFVGAQSETGTPTHKYKGEWYSFPAGGVCATPNGAKNCTYRYKIVGWIKIDDLVNSKDPKKPEITPNYYKWCLDGHTEMSRSQRGSPQFLCGTYKQTSVAFWNGLCIQSSCDQRIKSLDNMKLNTKLDNGCDSATDNIYQNGDVCLSECPFNTYYDWDYRCHFCDQNLHCQTCNSPEKPGGNDGGKHCLSCDPSSVYHKMVNKECMTKCGNGTLSFLYNGICYSVCPENTVANGKLCEELTIRSVNRILIIGGGMLFCFCCMFCICFKVKNDQYMFDDDQSVTDTRLISSCN